MPGTYQVFQPDDRVIQYALRDAIQQNAAGCEVTEPLEVVLGEDDISIVGENSSVSVPVRFKRVYNLAYQVAAKDTRDPAFDKRNPALVSGCPESDNNCVLPGLVASTQEAGDYTLVVISDNNYKLKGRPFLFMFAAEDRPPVFRGVPGGTINYDAGHELSMTVADPDENQVTVSCTGIDATVNPGTIDGIGAVTITLNSGSGDLECTATAKGRSTTIIIQVEENTAGGPGPIL
jgi:hypothetical protein